MTESGTIPQLLSIEQQLANRLGITVRHVRRLVPERRMPYYKVGRLVRFDPTEIATWLNSRRVTVTKLEKASTTPRGAPMTNGPRQTQWHCDSRTSRERIGELRRPQASA
jgi:excisionase family DNA binding protein